MLQAVLALLFLAVTVLPACEPAAAAAPCRNLIANGSAEVDLDGWSTSGDPSTLTRVPGGQQGDWGFRLRVPDGTTGNAALVAIPARDQDTIYTASVWASTLHTDNPVAPTALPVLAVHDRGPHFVYTQIPDDGITRRLTLTWTAPAGQPQTVAISDPRLVHSDVDFDGLQVELGATATDYCDG